eukprot:s4315_g2.t1
MWGGPGCDGTWPGVSDGWSENWNQWGWPDGWPEDPSYGNSWPPGPPGPGVPQKKVSAAPIANIPPIKDVASLVSARLFTGPAGAGEVQGAVTNGGTGPAASSQSSLDSAALLAYQQMQQQEYGDDGPFGGLPMPADDISTEVKNLVTRYDIRDKKIELRLIEALKHRGDRWVADIQDYRSCLSRARNPAGFLIVKLSDMEKAINAEQGTTIGAARELCANYRRGHCNRGDSCKYSHDVQVGLSKATNVANLIAEAQKSAANLGFSGGFSSAAAPPALPSAPGPLASPMPMPSPSPPMSMPMSMPSVERSERQEVRESVRSPRKASRSARRSRSRPRVARSRSRDRARDSRARSRNYRGRDSRDRRPRGRDSRSRGRRR